MSYPGTARDHLNWAVDRASEYAAMGDWVNAWTSFASDIAKHDGTKYIASHTLFTTAMFSGVYDRDVQRFRDFLAGWSVAS